MSRRFKVSDCWKERKICRKMYLIEQKSCNSLPQIDKKRSEQMWEMESAKQGHCYTLQEKIREKKCFSKKLKVTGTKCRDK